MMCQAGIIVGVLLAFLGRAHSDPGFCQRGFPIAGKYHECWESATYANKYPPLYEPHEFYTGQMVEEYATHMCSVVKPVALDCLRDQVKDCSNAQKLVDIADESGGACVRNGLNPAFKKHIIDHLVSIPGDSPCFTIADKSYECYVAAGEMVKESGGTVDIARFHKVADKFFDSIWDCEIKLFKEHTDICEHWQIPMLLALQRTAMPSLFGMRLNNEQISKLGLEPNQRVSTTKSPLDCEGGENEGDKFFIMLKVLTDKNQATDGDVLLEVDPGLDEVPQISVARGNSQDDKDISAFVGQMIGNESQLSLKEIRKLRKEQRKKDREIKAYIKRIKEAQRKRNKEKKMAAEAKKKAQQSQKKNTNDKGRLLNGMIA